MPPAEQLDTHHKALTLNLDPTIFPPELAGNLSYIIQGLVILFVSADVLVLALLRRGGGLLRFGRRRARQPVAQEAKAR